MARQYLELDESGTFPGRSAATDEKHTFVLRRLVLDHRYHDDDPVQGASYRIILPNGHEITGELDETGKATVYGVPGGSVEVRFGPDTREYRRVDETKNPDHRDELSDSDIDALIEKYRR